MADKQSYYFSHDSNARNDIKIMKLRRKHGMSGYGIYWCIIEILRDTADYKLSTQDIEDIAFQIGEDVEKVTSIVTDFGLFQVQEACFFSHRLLRNMQSFAAKRQAQSMGGKKAQQNKKKLPKQDEPFI